MTRDLVCGFVLAGGRSTRMGTNKALLLLDGEPLVQRALRVLAAVCDEVAIAGGAPELAGFGRVIADDLPDCGPLGGIVAALRQSPAEWNVFLSVDTPLVPVRVLEELLAARDASVIGVLAQSGGTKQPLCAVYNRRALPVLKQALEDGRLKVTAALELAGALRCCEFQDEQWFCNLNTPQEFSAVRKHLEAGE